MPSLAYWPTEDSVSQKPALSVPIQKKKNHITFTQRHCTSGKRSPQITVCSRGCAPGKRFPAPNRNQSSHKQSFSQNSELSKYPCHTVSAITVGSSVRLMSRISKWSSQYIFLHVFTKCHLLLFFFNSTTTILDLTRNLTSTRYRRFLYGAHFVLPTGGQLSV